MIEGFAKVEALKGRRFANCDRGETNTTETLGILEILYLNI